MNNSWVILLYGIYFSFRIRRQEMKPCPSSLLLVTTHIPNVYPKTLIHHNAHIHVSLHTYLSVFCVTEGIRLVEYLLMKRVILIIIIC